MLPVHDDCMPAADSGSHREGCLFLQEQRMVCKLQAQDIQPQMLPALVHDLVAKVLLLGAISIETTNATQSSSTGN
jgi:hypothetical protein